MKKATILLILLFFSGLFTVNAQEKFAGFRASRILQSYPNNQFPSPQYWSNAGYSMSGFFPGSQPAGIWIVSLYIDNGITQLNFPSDGTSYPYINFIWEDRNEEWLDYFDQSGLKVWLQVEPGAADIDTLISIVLNRYKHHSCVIGFGVDVEWYNTHQYPGGQQVADADAERWEQNVKNIDSSYSLFLKHYTSNRMPDNYRGEIIFVDDSQDFGFASNPFQYMINEFTQWGNKFSPNKVAFQFGYPADRNWWSQLSNPPGDIGNALFNNINNCAAVFWVDFTITEIFPLTSVESQEPELTNYLILGNYPNPFNPSTTIEYEIPEDGAVTITIADITGRQNEVRHSAFKRKGKYKFKWNGSGRTSGIYICAIRAGNLSKSIKLLLLK